MLPLVHYPVACRGCWMHGANEVLRCPRKYFLFIPQNFRRPFFISCQISGQFATWMPPPVLHHAPVTTFFSSLFAISLHFLHETGPVDAPTGWMPGAVAPSAPPLHATGTTL